MKIQITTKKLTISESHRDRIERRLYFTLSRFARKITSVEMMLRDENGPRGGVDKTCRVIVKLGAANDVVVEGHGEDTLSLVDRTTDRVGRAVSRALDYRKSRVSVRTDGEASGRRV